MCSGNVVHWTVALLAMLHQLEFSSIVQYADWLPAVCNVFYVDSELSESSFRNRASWSPGLVREVRQVHEELIQRIKCKGWLRRWVEGLEGGEILGEVRSHMWMGEGGRMGTSARGSVRKRGNNLAWLEPKCETKKDKKLVELLLILVVYCCITKYSQI